MGLCDIDYVRAHIYTGTLADADITAIITEVTDDILAQCATTLETNPLVILAGKYAVLAAVLTRMKTTGEMAASRETPGSKQQNAIDIDIARYESKSQSYISQYNFSSSHIFTSPSFNCGFASHQHCGGHNH